MKAEDAGGRVALKLTKPQDPPLLTLLLRERTTGPAREIVNPGCRLPHLSHLQDPRDQKCFEHNTSLSGEDGSSRCEVYP